MKKTMMMAVSLVAALMASPAFSAEPAKPAAPAAKPAAPAAAPNAEMSKADQDKTLYALGLSIGKSLGVFSLSKTEVEQVKKGLTDAVTGVKPQVELETWGPKIQELARSRSQVKADAEKKVSGAYLEKAAKEPGVTKLPSGLLYKELKAGTGASPAATDTVKVNYRGTLVNGTEFDSSYKRNEPISFALNAVIPCWTEGVQKLKVGGKAQLICPSNIAYGDRGSPPVIPGGATLIFEVELLDVQKTPPPQAPQMQMPTSQPGQGK